MRFLIVSILEIRKVEKWEIYYQADLKSQKELGIAG